MASTPRQNVKIKKGDTVEVLTGKYASRRGVVLRVLPRENRLVVEQVNIVKRHTKPRPITSQQQVSRSQPTGGVIEKEAPMAVSNVLVVCPGCDKPTRIGFSTKDDGRKVRTCRNEGCRVDIDK